MSGAILQAGTSVQSTTGCARDCDLFKLVSFGKFVNEILFCIIYKTLYLTLGHHALGGILCSCLNFLIVETAKTLLPTGTFWLDSAVLKL